MKIVEDSILFFRSVNPYSVSHVGFFQYKLSKKEYTRINRQFNDIDLNKLISLDRHGPDANKFKISVYTATNETYECNGNCSEEWSHFIYYISNLEKVLQLEKVSSLDDKNVFKEQENSE